MTEQDRAGTPAKESEFRAVKRGGGMMEVIMLQYPNLIKHFPDHTLEKRNDDGTWSAYTPELPKQPPAQDTHQENVEEQTQPGA